MRILVFDLETRMLAIDLNPQDEQAGWDALKRGEGGISSLVIFDSEEKWPFLYDDLSIETAARQLEFGDVVIGYNSEKFDIPVIEGLIHRKLALKQHIDLYVEIAKANAKKGIRTQRGDLTLDSVSRRCLGKGKTGKGAMAPDLVREGRFGELFNYCAHDVKLTLELLQYICQHGGVVNMNNSFLGLTLPDYIVNSVKEI